MEFITSTANVIICVVGLVGLTVAYIVSVVRGDRNEDSPDHQ